MSFSSSGIVGYFWSSFRCLSNALLPPKQLMLPTEIFDIATYSSLWMAFSLLPGRCLERLQVEMIKISICHHSSLNMTKRTYSRSLFVWYGQARPIVASKQRCIEWTGVSSCPLWCGQVLGNSTRYSVANFHLQPFPLQFGFKERLYTHIVVAWIELRPA